jgi:SAM-dependent methyltransferase
LTIPTNGALNSKEYWEKRILSQGLNAVSTVGDVKQRTEEETRFLLDEVLEVYPSKVDLAIDFGAGWGRLLPVLTATSKKQVLVDFVEESKRLFFWRYGENSNGSTFVVSSIKDFKMENQFDYAMTSFSLLHIIEKQEFCDSVRAIKETVRPGGHLFIYESYNESGKVADHCSNRNRSEFLEPFESCVLIKEIDWRSSYQPYETKCHQPIKLFIFRR